MMEAFAFRGTGTKPFGESRITESVMTITQHVLRTLVYMAVSAAFYAHPKQYLLGLTEEQYDKISKNKWGAMINAMLLGELNEENENSIQYGQLPATSPQPYIEYVEDLRADVQRGNRGADQFAGDRARQPIERRSNHCCSRRDISHSS